jgi:hypothetical protein
MITINLATLDALTLHFVEGMYLPKPDPRSYFSFIQNLKNVASVELNRRDILIFKDSLQYALNVRILIGYIL